MNLPRLIQQWRNQAFMLTQRSSADYNEGGAKAFRECANALEKEMKAKVKKKGTKL